MATHLKNPDVSVTHCQFRSPVNFVLSARCTKVMAVLHCLVHSRKCEVIYTVEIPKVPVLRATLHNIEASPIKPQTFENSMVIEMVSSTSKGLYMKLHFWKWMKQTF
ncbi:uncharacterized protein LOC123318353 [Coccinella septempunctata]|uniref:uncharacterized protein LOC123318353 n=1 Tax=Coccinella septempunctata TaxID=41139 RepID=UPI001D089A30|nr:uncharacterized protein LOC123318353 [Coccinella septempunctata]